MTEQEILNILKDLTYKNWNFIIHQKDSGWNLQAELERWDTKERTKSGKWYVSPHITKSELVQLCLKCVISAEEHESRLNFKYKGAQIFKPHYDVEDLVNLSKKSEEKRK